MPNGKHGDHPVTEVVVHGAAVFAPAVDALIKELDGLGFWKSQVASEGAYNAYWEMRQTQQRRGLEDVNRLLEHLEDVLESEVRRLRGATERRPIT